MDIISTQSSPKIDENVYSGNHHNNHNNTNNSINQLDDPNLAPLKTVIVEQPLSSSVYNNTTNTESYHTTTTTTTNNTNNTSTISLTKSKRNSDSFDPKELRVSELETSSLGNNNNNSTNKRHSLQLLSSTSFNGSNSLSIFNNRSPYDSPTKISKQHLSLVFNSIKKNQPPANKFGESTSTTSGGGGTTTAIIPPSPHYTVRKSHASQIQFPTTPQTQRKDLSSDIEDQQQDLEYGYQSMSGPPSFSPDTFIQDLLTNPQGEMSEQQLEAILINLQLDSESIADIISKIPSERGIIHNSELLKLFNHHIMDVIDNEDEDIKNHPINSLNSHNNINTPSSSSLNNSNSNSNSKNYNMNSNNSSIDIISQDNSSIGNGNNNKNPGKINFSKVSSSGPYEFESVPSTEGQSLFEYESYTNQVENLKKELILKTENEKDLMNKKKLLEEDNQRLLEEIKNKDFEQTKLKKEVSTKKDIDKKKNELATEVETYRLKEIQHVKQTDDLKKQISQLSSKLKQKKLDMTEIEKEKETKGELVVKLENENKNLKIKLNSQTQKYEEILNQMMSMESSMIGNNSNNNNSGSGTQSPALINSDMLSTNVNILNSSQTTTTTSNLQQENHQQQSQYRTLDQSIFRQSQLNDQKNFITPSAGNDHNMFLAEIQLTLDSVQKENTELKEELKEMKELNSKLEITKSELYNELTREVSLVNEMSQSSMDNVKLIENLLSSFNNLSVFIQDSTVLPHGQNQQVCLLLDNSSNNNNNDTKLQLSLDQLNSKWNQLFIEISQIKSSQNSTIERLLKKNESFTSIINTKNETIKKQDAKIEALEQNIGNQLTPSEIRNTISSTFEQFKNTTAPTINDDDQQQEEQEIDQVDINNSTITTTNQKKGGSKLFNAIRNLLSLVGVFFLLLLFVTLFITPNKNRLESVS